MMVRRIIQIDEEKCNGCGACARACHEGAIGMVNGKAKLLRDDYCDGLGDCLPTCPTGAITFVEREADAYNEQAVQENKNKRPAGCPGQQLKRFHPEAAPAAPAAATASMTSQLGQWPCQIKLVPVNAPYFDQAKLLHCGRLYGVCLCQSASGIHAGQDHAGRLPQAGRCGLQHKADRNHPQQRHSQRHHRADGGPLLRRIGTCRQKGVAEQRKVPSLAGGDHLHRRQDSGMPQKADLRLHKSCRR